MHASRSGIASLVATDEDDAMDIVAEILSFFLTMRCFASSTTNI